MQPAHAARTRHQGSPIVASLGELIALRSAALRIDLESLRSSRAKALLAGPYHSPFRGRGIEFDEVRAYQPGDDARFIDWRVSARRGRVYTKMFHEERERPVLFLVDQGPTMRFGTRRCFKSVAAARAAATLAWTARLGSDRVGGVIVSPQGRIEHPAERRQRHLLRWLEALSRASGETGDTEIDLSASIARLDALAPSGSHAILLSDFYGLDATARDAIVRLARRRHVSCVQIYDALEAEPPPPGRYRLSDGTNVRALEAGNRATRERWGQQFEARRESLRQLCVEHRIPLLCLRNDQAIEDVLGARMTRRAYA